MLTSLLPRAPRQAVPLTLLKTSGYKNWLKNQPASVASWLKSQSFKAKPGNHCVIPGAKGAGRVVACISEPVSLWDIASLSRQLPPGVYRLEGDVKAAEQESLALGWLLGAYRFTRYKKGEEAKATLALSGKADFGKIKSMAETIFMVRDLINTPAEDMGPANVAAAIAAAGKKHGAKVTSIVGDALLKKSFAAVHAVGRASPRAPRLIDLSWGNPKHPRVTLIGKGVCFDTGGLDIKPSGAMYLMKKDMAGAAIALGTAILIMKNKLPVRLRLLIPAVDNAVSGNAMRPTDIIKMRDGKTVEIGDTDAEGRLILADALAEAVTEPQDLVVDFSTLTGSARSAVGTEIAALFSNDDALAADLLEAGRETEDPLWRLPLFEAYEKMLDSPVADINSCPNSPYAGAITAALFLQRFVGKKQRWAHLDFMAWNLADKPGRPIGGEATALRAVYRLIEKRHGRG